MLRVVRIGFAVVLLGATTLIAPLAQAQAQTFSVDAVKATFLHRFAFYVQWPEAAISGDAFTIGVIDGDSVARQLETLLRDVRIQDRRAIVKRITRSEDLADVQILYVGPAATAATRKIREIALDRPVLLVTENPGGLADGAVVNFLPTTRNVRFEISLASARRRGLTINSELLSVAANVEGRAQRWSPCSEVEPVWVQATPCQQRVARSIPAGLDSHPFSQF